MFLSSVVKSYYPRREVSIYETIVAFKGKFGFRTYHPNVWSLAEAVNWNVYTGKEVHQDVADDMTYNVVMTLVHEYLHKGHHIYMDNYFSSPKLFKKLEKKETGACGTLRINRKLVPDTISQAKMKKPDPTITEKVNNLTYTSWFDKNRVNWITSVHDTSTFVSQVRAKDSPVTASEQ